MIKNLENEIENICRWIEKYVQNSGAEGVVIGNSGGKDCATVIALATKALGNEKVLTVAIPCNSIQADLEDARLLSEKFNVELLEVNITEAYEKIQNNIDKVLEGKDIKKEREKEAKINTKPRLRMTTLYQLAQSLNYLVMGTGNLCEITVGYTTKWGDNSSDLNPIGNFTVEEVLDIARYLNVPDKIVNKAPADGLGGLTDEEKMGITYKQVAEYIETGKTQENAMEIIERRKRTSEHKRRLVPVYQRTDKI